jgi:hypothetical protein
MFAAERALAAGFTSGGFPPFLAPVAISVGSLPFFSKESSNSDYCGSFHGRKDVRPLPPRSESVTSIDTAGMRWLFDATCGCARHLMLSYLDFACFTLSDGRFGKGERRAWNGGNLR